MYLYLFFLIFCIKKISGDYTPLTQKESALKNTQKFLSFSKGLIFPISHTKLP